LLLLKEAPRGFHYEKNQIIPAFKKTLDKLTVLGNQLLTHGKGVLSPGAFFLPSTAPVFGLTQKEYPS